MKILLPVDGSAASLDAVRQALHMIHDGLRASLVLANVQEPATLYEMLLAHDPEVIDQVSAKAGLHLLRAGAARWCARPASSTRSRSPRATRRTR